MPILPQKVQLSPTSGKILTVVSIFLEVIRDYPDRLSGC